MATNVPQPTFGPRGFVAPTEAEILAGVIADFQAAFGGVLNLSIGNPQSLTTPQGQLAMSMAAIIGDAYNTFVFYTNQVDPAFALGRMQDAIARIYFLERNPAQSTVVQAVCTGLSGVLIPVGALAQASDGNIYVCTQDGIIPNGGSITLSFACQVTGPIACPANSLNQIYRAITGWDSINNPTDGVEGNDVETRQAFEARRAASVALNSIGSLPSIQGAVLGVPGVLEAYVAENPTGSPLTITIGSGVGVSLLAHSIYVSVIGGVALDVATAIWSKKAPGANYNGNTTVTVTDTDGYAIPYPTYAVTFEIPPALPIVFEVKIASSALVPSNAAALIQAAIIAAFNGDDGGPRARIGSTIYASRFYAPVAALGAWVSIISIGIGSVNFPSAVIATSTIAGTALSVGSLSSGTIAVDQFVFDGTATVAVGTRIVSGSGSSWVVNISQTVGSETMTLVGATSNSVDVQINQVPTLTDLNILVKVI